MNGRRWDIFCRVIDNFGDIGVCWRLARQLASEYGVSVRLWVDDLQSFATLCPVLFTKAQSQFLETVEVCHWSPKFPVVDVADVVIEAFGCEIPATYLIAMAGRAISPIWINLEYLSAEPWVEDCHLLPSPQARSQLKKYFFFPGFTPRTGGLIRERDLIDQRFAFDARTCEKFWESIGIPRSQDSELRISLFCYDNSALPDLLKCWQQGPQQIRLLATPGAAADQISCWANRPARTGEFLRRGHLTIHFLPFLSQSEYDRLLWACDVNFVRGEDSFVRAQWAARPFVWQIYPQTENTHLTKLEAFMAICLAQSDENAVIRHVWNAWNGIGDIGPAWREFAGKLPFVTQHAKVWASQLDRGGDLANNLVSFVSEK